MSLSAKRVLVFDEPVEKISDLAAESDTYYKGMLLCWEAAGYLVPPSDAAALEVAGVYNGRSELGVDDALVVGSGEHPRLELERGRVRIPFSGAAQTDVGDLAYVADDTTLTKTAGSKTIAYRVEDFETGYLWIDIRRPIKLS
jgi:hypothetical protein